MKLKQTNASAHLVQYRFKIREGSPEGRNQKTTWRKGFVKKVIISDDKFRFVCRTTCFHCSTISVTDTSLSTHKR